MKKRLITMALMVMTMLAVTVSAGAVESDPIVVKDEARFIQAMKENATKADSDVVIRLDADIVFDVDNDGVTGSSLVPQFWGTLDGDGHTLTIVNNSGTNYFMIKTAAGNAVIKNLKIINDGGHASNLSMYVNGYASTPVVFDNVDILDNPEKIYAMDNNESPYTACVAGYLKMINCDNHEQYNSSTYCAVFVGGYLYGGSTDKVDFENCNNYGDFYANNASMFLGNTNLSYGTVDTVSVTDCHNYGIISGSADVGTFGNNVAGDNNYDGLEAKYPTSTIVAGDGEFILADYTVSGTVAETGVFTLTDNESEKTADAYGVYMYDYAHNDQTGATYLNGVEFKFDTLEALNASGVRYGTLIDSTSFAKEHAGVATYSPAWDADCVGGINGMDYKVAVVDGTLYYVLTIDNPSNDNTYTMKTTETTTKVMAYNENGSLIGSEAVDSIPAVTVPGIVAEVDGTAFIGTLADAVATAKDGETVKLLCDVPNGTGVVATADTNVIIDLNNYTYTAGAPLVGSTGTETNGFQLLKGAKVTMKNGIIKPATTGTAILMQNYCDFTAENVTFDCSNSSVQYVLSNNHGSLTVKGNTNVIAADGQKAFDLWYGMSEGYRDGITVTFDSTFTGTIQGDIEYGRHTNASSVENWTDKTKLTISGDGIFTGEIKKGGADDLDDANITISSGSFTYKPAENFIAGGYTVSDTTNDDGYYTVTNQVADTVTDAMGDVADVTTDNATDKKNEITAAAGTVTSVPNEDLLDHMDDVNKLDDLLLSANDGSLETDVAIDTSTAIITGDDDIADVTEDDLKVNTSADTAVSGLALAVVGGDTIATDTTVKVTLNIKQTAASVSKDAETEKLSADVTYDISPSKATTTGGVTTTEDNVAIKAPVTFKLHLPSIFNDTNRAELTHAGVPMGQQTVYHDGEDSYINVTATHFSEFTVKYLAYQSTSSGVSSFTGTVSKVPSGCDITMSPAKAKMGQTVTITADLADGYTLVVYKHGDKEIALTDLGNGKYTFVMPGTAITVTAVPVEEPEEEQTPATTFTDVDENAYYYDAMTWAVENGITAGTTDTTFAPGAPCTRGQIVTFLYRAAGSPAVTGDTDFVDVDENAYYHDAMVWAVENGITAGTTATTFDPSAPCTRGQIVTFLWRAAGTPDVSGSALDVNAGTYCYDAVIWAVDEGITTGYAGGTFGAPDACNRGQIVTFLYRYMGE